jgi:putative hemolysin
MYTDLEEIEVVNRLAFKENKSIISHRRADSLTSSPPLLTRWARHQDEVVAAQRLRYHVFAEEMGAKLPCKTPGVEEDVFDPFCEHLLVIDEERQMVVGTYRLLTPVQAKRVGGWYSETEFDLVRLRPFYNRMVELGRSCVHPDYRNGAVIMALWGALAHFMRANNVDTMMGCASVGMQDGGHGAASLWQQLRGSHLASIAYQVYPRLALPVDLLSSNIDVEAPALLKGYLRLGSKILGAPAWDPDFNCADFPLMMRLQDLHPRYRKHFQL